MTDKKITSLTALTTPDDADVLPIVDVSAAVTKKVTVANLRAGGLPSQWTDGGNGDVTAETDNDTTPLSIVAPESGSNGPFALQIEPAGPGFTGAIMILTGDPALLSGNAYVIRVMDEIGGTQTLDIDAWGGMIMKARSTGAGFQISAVDGLTVFRVIANATNTDSLMVVASPIEVNDRLEVQGSGVLMLGNVSAPADGDLGESQLALWFDDTNGAAYLMSKAKTADGTVVSGRLRLGHTVQTYAASNVTTDRTYDANATSIDELADVLGTLIADLRAQGLVA